MTRPLATLARATPHDWSACLTGTAIVAAIIFHPSVIVAALGLAVVAASWITAAVYSWRVGR